MCPVPGHMDVRGWAPAVRWTLTVDVRSWHGPALGKIPEPTSVSASVSLSIWAHLSAGPLGSPTWVKECTVRFTLARTQRWLLGLRHPRTRIAGNQDRACGAAWTFASAVASVSSPSAQSIPTTLLLRQLTKWFYVGCGFLENVILFIYFIHGPSSKCLQ